MKGLEVSLQKQDDYGPSLCLCTHAAWHTRGPLSPGSYERLSQLLLEGNMADHKQAILLGVLGLIFWHKC